MSSRNLRRMREEPVQPPDSDDSEDDYSPPPNRRRTTYEGLVLSDESEAVLTSESEEVSEPVASTSQGGTRKKTAQKKKIKNKKRKNKIRSADLNQDVSRYDFSNALEELDEIDRSVMEVNAILGAPPPAPAEPEVLQPIATAMTIEARFLNVSVEQRKIFGPEEPEEVRMRNRYQPHRGRVLRRVLVTPNNDTRIYDYKRSGLTMSVAREEDDVTYFVYDHDQELQRRHLKFLEYYAHNFMLTNQTMLQNLPRFTKYMHVEALLEVADRLFRLEENSLANELIENIVVYLQFTAHPSFDLTRTNARLSYVYRENRPFHVAMLKYAYLLSNKACHRTALEIAKMLLNVDPSDPLAIVFIIDTLALRAREHEWLIQAINYFNEQRQANLLFNIQYSFALALFHVALKKKKDLSEADEYLQYAILTYPRVLFLILEYASINDPVLNHILFIERDPDDFYYNEDLVELMQVYARLTWPRWREPPVIKWVLRNARQITEKYDNDVAIRTRAREMTTFRDRVFVGWPAEITRHMHILAPMANLILDMPIRTRRPRGGSWDPLFDNGIDRYGYKAPTDPPSRNVSLGGRALLYRFFTSIIPSTELEPPVND